MNLVFRPMYTIFVEVTVNFLDYVLTLFPQIRSTEVDVHTAIYQAFVLFINRLYALLSITGYILLHKHSTEFLPDIILTEMYHLSTHVTKPCVLQSQKNGVSKLS